MMIVLSMRPALNKLKKRSHIDAWYPRLSIQQSPPFYFIVSSSGVQSYVLEAGEGSNTLLMVSFMS
ncbi:hypothetical protein ACEQPO_01295 [Bacillus sp. SL00103]